MKLVALSFAFYYPAPMTPTNAGLEGQLNSLNSPVGRRNFKLICIIFVPLEDTD